ncbi:MAG: hypothetical protein ABIA75_10045 [Candidatus Neomarinimicrobiota bacterium]
MNLLLTFGTRIVILALIAYSVAIFTEQRRHLIIDRVLWFITIGVILDITATVCMIAGSPNSPFTVHGFIGYSSLAAMLIDAVLLWSYRRVHDATTIVPRKLHLYSRAAYIWWVLAFITGGVLVALKYS